MFRLICLCALVAAVFGGGPPYAAPAFALDIVDRIGCAGGRVVIENAGEAEAELICSGVESAAAAMAQCGFAMVPELTVEVAERLTTSDGFKRRGEFLSGSGRVRILPIATLLRDGPTAIAGVSLPRGSLYASIVAHETTHAIFEHGAGPLDLVPTAHEYVAYAIQVSTLPVDVRTEITRRFPERPLKDLFVFSPFLLYADPERFAVAAFRHFEQAENGCAMLKRIISRQVYFPPPSD